MCNPVPPAALTVAPDNGTWNAPGSFDVLSNDSASRGAVTLTAVTGAVNGAATSANGKTLASDSGDEEG